MNGIRVVQYLLQSCDEEYVNALKRDSRHIVKHFIRYIVQRTRSSAISRNKTLPAQKMEPINTNNSNAHLNRLMEKKMKLKSLLSQDQKLSRAAIVNKLASQTRSNRELESTYNKRGNINQIENNFKDNGPAEKQGAASSNQIVKCKGAPFKVIGYTVSGENENEDQQDHFENRIDSGKHRRNSQVKTDTSISGESSTPIIHSSRIIFLERLQKKKRNIQLKLGPESKKTDIPSSLETCNMDIVQNANFSSQKNDNIENSNFDNRSDTSNSGNINNSNDDAYRAEGRTTSPNSKSSSTNSNASTSRHRRIRKTKKRNFQSKANYSTNEGEFSNNMNKTSTSLEGKTISLSNADICPVITESFNELNISYPNNYSTETTDNKKISNTNMGIVQHQSGGNSSIKKQEENVKSNSLNDIEEKAIEANLTKHLVLVHGKHIAQPIERLAKANFCKEVHRELSMMRWTQIYRIQAYSWPHLLRGNSLIIINPARSGKTLAYLPAICSIIKMKIDDNMIPEGIGPIGIILATSSVEVEKIAGMCSRFFNSSTKKLSILKAYGVRNANEVSAQLLNGCDILIATVPCLSRILSHRIKHIDTKRIQHLVIDNIDLMNDNLKPDLQKILRKCCSLNKNRTSTFVQLVITARSWNPYMSGFLKICKNPQLCIGSHHEAAVYARSKISLNLVKNSTKGYEIIQFIQAHPYITERLVIVCNKDEEIKEIIEALKSINAKYVFCNSKSTANEMELARGWHNQKNGEMTVLICTDSVLPELNIRKAQNMLSYSLSSSWTKFSSRFSVFLDYYEDLIQNDTLIKPAACSLILLDENNNSQLPKLVEFLQDHGQSKIPTEILNLSQRIRVQRETNHISEMTELCPLLLDYGNCLEKSDCKRRHILTKHDTPDEKFPTEGLIKIKILNVISPIHYCVRLFEMKSIKSGSTWIKVNKSENYLNFNIQFSQYFADSGNHEIHWPINVGDLCVVIDSNMYHRCKIVEAQTPKKGLTTLDINLRVKLVDNGTIITCRSSNILVLPEQFTNFPFQAIDLHLVGIVPQDFEQVWDTNVTKTVKHWFDQYCSEDNYVEASIKLFLCNTFWVENMRIVEKLNEIASFVIILDIKQALLDGKYGVPNTFGIENLQQMASECGIVNISVPKKNITLASENISDELNKDKILVVPADDNNECNPNHLVKLSDSDSDSDLNSNDLVLNVSTGLYDNVKSTSINEKEIEEDLGDHPKEKWEKLPENKYSRVSVGAFYNPNLFYVQNVSNINNLESLYSELNKYTSSNKRRNVTDPKIGMNCIAKIDGKYNRGKITKLICEPFAVSVEVFFVDIGLKDVINLDAILQSTDYFIKVLPFQAIRCRLLGIQPLNNGIWHEEVCDKIYDDIIDQCDFIYARNIRSELPARGVNGLNCIRHEVILLDCTTDDDIKLNETIIEKGLANYDPDTKHFLDLLTCLDLSDDDSDETNWDHCNYQRPQPQTIIAPNTYETNSADGLQIFDFDINFTEDETLRLINAPPTAKILPVSDTPRFTEVYDEKCTPIEKNNPEIKAEEIFNQQYFESYTKDDNASRNENMPIIKAKDKIPEVVWQQSDSVICLNIYAPDINDYYLKVTPTCLIFSAMIEDQKNVLVINFLGGVDPEITSHEIRGLNVVVRLVKALKGFAWPRLCFESDRHIWLKCKFGGDIFDNKKSTKSYTELKSCSSNYYPSGFYDTDNDSSDTNDRNDDFKNCDTIYDPLADF